MDNHKTKQVMKVEMFGRKVVVLHNETWYYEFRVAEVRKGKTYWVDEFDGFGEAAERAVTYLYD